MKICFSILVLLCLIQVKLPAQIGGNETFSFLNLSVSPRQEALGGKLVPMNAIDPELIYQNPSVLDSSMSNSISAAVQFYPANIQFGLFHYVPKQKGKLLWSFGTQYANYGTIVETDENGIKLGRVSSTEMANFISLSREIDGIEFGSNIKLINSFLADYYAMGLAIDLSVQYALDTNKTNLNLSIRNLGVPVIKYTDEAMQMPLDIQFGISRKLDHMPLTVFTSLHHLNRNNLTFDNALSQENVIVISDSASASNEQENKWVDNAFRHVVVGGEFNFSDKFYFRLAYNYLRRQDLKVTSNLGTVGFTWGIGMNFKKWNCNYSRSNYHLSFSPNNLSISFRI